MVEQSCSPRGGQEMGMKSAKGAKLSSRPCFPSSQVLPVLKQCHQLGTKALTEKTWEDMIQTWSACFYCPDICILLLPYDSEENIPDTWIVDSMSQAGQW